MTILAALHEPNGSIWIGCDRRAISGSVIFTDRMDKWLQGDGWALGIAGAAGLLSIAAREASQIVDPQPDAFADHMRRYLSDIGWQADCTSGESPHRRSDIAAVMQGKVWSLDVGLGVAYEIKPGHVWCWGSGREYGLGAAFAASSRQKSSAKHMVTCAIEAAIRFDPGCGGEPWVKQVQ